MKKILAFLLTVAICSGIAACGTESSIVGYYEMTIIKSGDDILILSDLEEKERENYESTLQLDDDNTYIIKVTDETSTGKWKFESNILTLYDGDEIFIELKYKEDEKTLSYFRGESTFCYEKVDK